MPEYTMPGDESMLIDWDAVWQRLDWSVERRLETIDAMLAQRATRYAQVPKTDDLAERDALAVLEFRRGQERYAVPVFHVVRGLVAPRITPVPCTPPHYRGVIHLRGRIISVLDVSRFWGLPAEDPPGVRLLIVRAARLELALQTDDILGLVDLPAGEIASPLAASVALEHVQGVSAQGTVILDVESLLQDPRLIVHEELN